MDFDNSEVIDQICWGFRYADSTRSKNRGLIDNLFNGVPPFSDQEVQENNIAVNVNFLESTRLSHDARSQFYQAFLKPGNYFSASTDYGPKHKRADYGKIVTKEIGKIMKRSLPYTEKHRSTFAQDVLHGIGPGGFQDKEHWCPEPLGIGDVMVPANTLLTMKNLPFFAIHRSFTGPELIKLTQGPNPDPAWKKTLVDACIKWLDEESRTQMGSNFPEVWTPEKAAERQKSDGGFYAYDNAPTIDCWDFYFWNDDKKHAGWNRRMILDAWSNPSGVNQQMTRKKGVYETTKDFLYNPGKRIFADAREQIINWQFADLSAVAPFRYHSVRSLGFLLYAVCHLQNRLRCKFSESVFEQLMIYFRVKSADDMQRALKIELATRGFIDDSVEFIKAADRYQVNAGLVELGLNENSNIINQNANSNTANRSESGARSEKPTATQWMGEEAKITQLVSAGLMQAYLYQVPEYREIFRRFCIKNSSDPDVRRFQAACLKQRVPEKVLMAECWELEPERVLGAGNKTLEMGIAQQLMQYRNLFDPEPQRQILRDVTLAITDDPARADSLVPEAPRVSDTVHDTELVFSALMHGTQITPKSGVNNLEVIGVMLHQMGIKIKSIMQSGGMGTMQDVQGLAMCEKYITHFIQQLAQDPNEKEKVKQAGDMLGKLMNEVKGMAQRLQEQAQKQAESNGDDPEVAAKVKSMLILADAKAENTRTSHAQRTTQRQLQWEQEMDQKQKEFQQELQQGSGEAQAQREIQLMTAESQQSMSIQAHQAALDAAEQRHSMKLKEMQADLDMRLKEKDAELKREIAKKDAEVRQEVARTQARARPKPSE